jgi:hypothetical protein
VKRLCLRHAVPGIALIALATAGGPAAEQAGPRALVERFARLLERRDAVGVAALYHRGALHRDLATGELVRGSDALVKLYANRLAESDTLALQIDSFRLLTRDVAVAQLSAAGARRAAGRGASRPWPAYTALVLSREDGRWGLAATRAGGNPATSDGGLPLARPLSSGGAGASIRPAGGRVTP